MTCSACGMLLEVVGLTPLQMDWLWESPLSVPWYTDAELPEDDRERL